MSIIENPGWRGGIKMHNVCRITGRYDWACQCESCKKQAEKYAEGIRNLTLDKSTRIDLK